MSTRAIIARVEGDDVLGVLNLHDSFPWELGNLLLLELLDRAGDLAGALDTWITRAPGAWSWLPDRAQVEGDEQPFWRHAELTGEGWVAYLYLFDPGARTLRVGKAIRRATTAGTRPTGRSPSPRMVERTPLVRWSRACANAAELDRWRRRPRARRR
ncbi:hypothetical protein [Sorangium sp. So ce861]|uniref:hypothetical protein n=1 Tax=Sorangium sp. So ce861 TaxID=3133323 RepID=UPI003F640B14